MAEIDPRKPIGKNFIENTKETSEFFGKEIKKKNRIEKSRKTSKIKMKTLVSVFFFWNLNLTIKTLVKGTIIFGPESLLCLPWQAIAAQPS